MKKNLKILAILIVTLIMSTMLVYANGFAIYEHGTRAMGQASAFTARASDPSAIWFNPAGITQLPDTQIYLGGSGLLHDPQISSGFYGDTYTTDNDLLLSPHIYLTHQISKDIWIGIGVSTPYNYENYWGEGPESDSNPVVAAVSLIKTRTTVISPVLALKLSDKFSVGLGLHYVMGNFQLTSWDSIDELIFLFSGGTAFEGDLKNNYDVSSKDIAFFGGIQWKISPDFVFGFNYHSGVDGVFEGTIDFTPSTTGINNVDALLNQVFLDQNITVNATNMVDQFTFGVAVNLGDKLELEADLGLLIWSQFTGMEVKFSQHTSAYGMNILTDDVILWEWENSMNFRFGGEFHANKSLDLRFGFLYDRSPVPAEYLEVPFPFANRIGLSMGIGYKLDCFQIDLAYMMVFDAKRSESRTDQDIFDMVLEATTENIFALSLGLEL